MTKKQYFKLFIISFFVIFSICFVSSVLIALSSFPVDSLLSFYLFFPISLLLFLIGVFKLINIIKQIRNGNDSYEKYIKVAKITNKIVVFLISFGLIGLLGYSAYQVYITNQKQQPFYETLNSLNFTDYEEDEQTKYNTGFIESTSIFGDKETVVLKMAFINETKHQIIIEGTHIETSSSILTNLKYHLMKKVLMQDKEYFEKDNCVCFYNPGRYDGIIKYSEIIILAKGEKGFVYVNVQTSTPDVQIDVDKALSYCNNLVTQGDG